MKIPFPENITMESVFVWLLHRISEEFEDHAILKGGVALQLLDCSRYTNDIDYTFVPYNSKKEIEKKLKMILNEIPNAQIETTMNSKALRASISIGSINVQVEAGVSLECKSVAVSTNSIARKVGQLGKVLRIMSPDVALSHKLAAWNERRLLRDLYDIYYIYQIIGEKPDIETLLRRLEKVESRIPRLKKIKRMALNEFVEELQAETNGIDKNGIEGELSPLLGTEEISGLDFKLKATLNSLIEYLKMLKIDEEVLNAE